MKKLVAFVAGLMFLASGISNLFLVKLPNSTGWGIFFLILGGLSMWYWAKKK